MINVITAIFWDYDTLKLQPKQDVECNYICYTDNPNLKFEEWADKQWTIIVDNSKNLLLHTRMRSRWYKYHYETDWIVVWIDGSIRMTKENSISHAINELWKNDIITFKHPTRGCIYKEAEECLTHIKYQHFGDKILQHISQYTDYPINGWLSMVCVLVMKYSKNIQLAFNELWNDLTKYTYMDQFWFDPLCKKYKIKKVWFMDDMYSDEYFTIKNAHNFSW